MGAGELQKVSHSKPRFLCQQGRVIHRGGMRQNVGHLLCERPESPGILRNTGKIVYHRPRVQLYNQIRVHGEPPRSSALDNLRMKSSRYRIAQRPFMDAISAHPNFIRQGAPRRPHIDQVFGTTNHLHNCDSSGNYFHLSTMEITSIDIFSSIDMFQG
jgi:hypothetical protein